MILKGELVQLRPCEPDDLELLYKWENDTALWHITNTYIPYSKNTLKQYISSIQDIYTDKQLRLMIENTNGEAVGMIDLFDFDAFHQRAGIGILIADTALRGQGLGSDALKVLIRYAKEMLDTKILFCNVLESNKPSLSLFSKCGFEITGTKKQWHKSTQGREDEHFLQLIIV
jgi:diamine N-acetyltransferase